MKWSFRITTVLGTEVRIHATFALLLMLGAWQALSAGGGVHGALESILMICTMFVCVLLHEFGHVLAGRRYGIKTPEIILLPIGGVARMERMPKKPSEELVVAICGPLVNVVIAGLIAAGLKMVPGSFDANFLRPGHFWQTLMWWNVMMVLFNMVPAFPMDGGRVLRALLALFTGDYARATRMAAGIGQAFAVIAVTLVVFKQMSPMLLLMAMFVFFAAGQEAAMVTEEEQVADLCVRDAMLTDYRTLGPNAVLREAVDLLLNGTQHDFPVLDEHGGMMGVLTRTRLIGALAEHGANYPAQLIIERCEHSVEPMTPLPEAMQLLNIDDVPALAVMDPVQERMVGLLTAENVGEALMVRAALKQRQAAMLAA